MATHTSSRAGPMRDVARCRASRCAFRARASRSSRPSRQQAVQCQALMSLFRGLQPQGPDSKQPQFVERPAFKPSEMVEVAPGIKISPIGLGTWAWGNQFLWGYKVEQDPELQEVFNLVVSRGINFFDTGDSYGTGRLNGRSEQLLGQFCSEYPGSARVRSQLHVGTKLAAYPWRVLPGNMVAAAKGSLRRLDGQPLSLGQLHWSCTNYAPLQELAQRAGLGDLVDQGLVRAVGVSNYGPKELTKMYKFLRDERGITLATAQIQFSLLSYGALQQEAQAVCRDLGVTLISYSPLALGLLSGKYDGVESVPEGPRGTLFKSLLPEARPLLELMQLVADGRRKTMSQVAINWCVCQGTVPIPGARTLDQANEVLGSLGWRLSSGEVAELTAQAKKLKKGMVQNIFQTP